MHHSDYGYEYIPKEFFPAVLTPTLNAVHKLIFGASPDNYFINFRANELMSYLHSTELAEYVYRLDPRVTYWPKLNKPYFEPAGKRVLITQIYGSPQRLSVAGGLSSLTNVGHALNMYTISLRRQTQDGNVVLVMDVKHEGRINSLFTKTIENLGAPPIITLPETALNVRLNTSPYQMTYNNILTEIEDFIVIEAYDTDNADKLAEEKLSISSDSEIGLEAQWLIEAKANPQPLIATALPAIEMLGEPAFLEIFGLEDKEPYLTFKNLWFDHPLPVYRLSGIVLALIYRTNELRG